MSKDLVPMSKNSMVATRTVCTDLQEQCAPITMTLMTCLKYKDGLCDFKNALGQKVNELQDVLNHLQVRSSDIIQHWNEQVAHEEKEREEIKVVSQKAIAQVRKTTEETRVKRIALQQKNDALEERIKEKRAEQEIFRSRIKQEHQKAMDILLREQNKNEELSSLAEKHKQNVIMMETKLRDVTENREFWKNKLSNLQQKIADAKEMEKTVFMELENSNAKAHELEIKEKEFENILQKNNTIEMELSSEVEEEKKECTKMKEAINEFEVSYSAKKEAIASLQKLILEKKMQQEAHVLQYRSKIEKLKQDMQEKKNELLKTESELEQDKMAAVELLNKLQQNNSTICSLQQQFETANQEIAECKSNVESLEVEAKKWTENKEKAESQLSETEAKLHELKESLAAQNQKDEEFRSQATREKRELEQELMNVQRELQNSVANSEWIIQQTVTCVEQCKENYAQHVKEKEAVLATLKSEQQSLNKQFQEATSEKDHVETELKEKVKALEDMVAKLDLQLMNKKKLVANTPISSCPRKDEEYNDMQTSCSILKSPRSDKKLSKRVKFMGLSSDSDSSLVDAATLAAASVYRKSLNDPSSLQKRKNIEDMGKKFFKNKGQSLLTEKAVDIENFANFGED